MTKKDIGYVVDNRLCLSCGACATVCSKKSITFHETLGGYFYPEIEYSTCVQCGFCIDVCPGIHYIAQIHDIYLTNNNSNSINEVLIGRAVDDHIYCNAQSGGVVTGLLKDMLQRHIIDAVLCAGMNYNSPPRGEALFITDLSNLLQAQKSKYVPVPLLENLRNYLKKYDKIAVVGLPCHMHGLELLKNVIPEIKNKISIRIGLICDRILTAKSIDFLAKQATEKQVSHIIFRDKRRSGYPGDPSVEATDGEIIMMKASDRMVIKDFFTPVRCRLCLDKLNVSADIVCGDPHGMDGVDRLHGETLVFVRNDRGKQAIREAVEFENIALRSASITDAVNGQRIDQRVKDWRAYLQAWKSIGMFLPEGVEKKQVIGKKSLKVYENDIKQGLSLDRYKSVEEMFKAVDGFLKKKQMKRMIFTPLKLVKKVIKR
ncbi:MAG: 4Fe-4S dicluster domain-containing protein [Clostridiales bacterium]|nr:4Fe-4S dicluster domain-containing protein [Clostridiales bacterium]